MSARATELRGGKGNGRISVVFRRTSVSTSFTGAWFIFVDSWRKNGLDERESEAVVSPATAQGGKEKQVSKFVQPFLVICGFMFIGFVLGYSYGKQSSDKWWKENLPEIYWFGSDRTGTPHNLNLACPERDAACSVIFQFHHQCNDREYVAVDSTGKFVCVAYPKKGSQ